LIRLVEIELELGLILGIRFGTGRAVSIFSKNWNKNQIQTGTGFLGSYRPRSGIMGKE
jgi:hypothetical protein